MGFAEQDHSGDSMEAITRMFTPEFRNRLDAVVQFNSLGRDTISQVVDKFIIELEGQLEEKRVTIDVDEQARGWLAEHGYDRVMGARPMERIIQEHIKRPLAEELLFGQLEGGGNVRIGADDDGLTFKFEPLNSKPGPAKSKEKVDEVEP